jgi:hypothetical protein
MAFFRRAELFACLGALAFTGCVISDDDGETEASTSGNTMTTTLTTAGTADDDGGTATMGTMTTPGTGDDTAGDTASDTAGDTAATAGDTGPGGDAPEACLAACELGSGCEKLDPAECTALCDEAVGFAERDGCVDQFVDQQNCVAALDCTQYFDWLNEVGDPYPCAAEDEALFTCEGGGGDSSSGGGADSSSGG